MVAVSPSSGLCAPWLSEAVVNALTCDCDDDAANEPDATVLAEAATVAGQFLFILSGRKYPGTCTKTVIPLERGDCEPNPSRVPGWNHFLTPGDFPLTSIVSILVDGVAQDLADYQILDHTRIVRRMGAVWPTGDDWELSYQFGASPPDMGVLAAKRLACELALAFCGSSCCNLPKRVTSVTRQGMSAVLLDPFSMLDAGKLGIYEVDAFLAADNPGGITHPPTVTTVDTIGRVAVKTWSQ